MSLLMKIFFPFTKATTSTPTAVATPCPTSFSPSPVPPVCMVPSDDISVTPIALDATTTLTLSPTPGMASSSSTSNPSFFEPPLPITPAPPTCTHPMIKRHLDGTMDWFKACLVAKGFNQCSSVDYIETFSPVIKLTTIRLIFSLALSNNWPFKQIDVNNMFLHGQLTEQVFMQQPVGFIDQSYPHHVCSLQKSIYGLKQGPRAWVEVILVQQGLFLSQNHYVHDLLIKLKMTGAKEVKNTHVCVFHAQTDNHATGNMLNSFCAKSNRAFTSVLLHHQSNPMLRGFSDANWGGDLDDRKSTTAYIIFLGNNPISWRTRNLFLMNLGLTLCEPPLLLYDNVGATQLSLNPVMHSRMKHIAIDLHFVYDFVHRGKLCVAHVHKDDQLVDLLTKPLVQSRFNFVTWQNQRC
ncbi:Retrovirus-related Pol polyprotein from transposon RE2 [Vitis vinifera]|uniref:Retrovirus-related Pol polyprotein from transposon RE2 n=1 Tax=Vitis vinifera TaxID=29760 RepID=A0A438CC39_VITVI|nr:Retrovirus-related Pol polyprotein from transposon RE2 [Vitis vinifera]